MRSVRGLLLLTLMTGSWLVCLSSCGTQSPTGSTIQATPVPTPTPGTTVQPTSPPATVGILSKDCPANGQAVAASLAAGTSAAESAIFYIAENAAIQTSPMGSVLKRYNLQTGTTSTLLSFAGTQTGIFFAQLSPDKRWLLVVTQSPLASGTAPDGSGFSSLDKLLLLSADGSHRQTLYCAQQDSSLSIADPQWSPDSQTVVFRGLPFNESTNTATIHVLNLTTGTQTLLISGTYTPYAWINNHQFYVASETDESTLQAKKQLYLLDTEQRASQQPQLVATELAVCSSFALSNDAQQLFSATCTPKGLDNCRAFGFDGPGSLNTRSATGGTPTSLYSSQHLAILTIQAAGSSILFYQQATVGSVNQSGLWVIDATGKTTHLTTGDEQPCFEDESPLLLPHLASSASSYALLTYASSSLLQTLQVGNVSGGSARAIVTQNLSRGLLALVGMA